MNQKSVSILSIIIGAIIIVLAIQDIISLGPFSANFNVNTNGSMLLLGIFALIIGLYLKKKKK